jgi:hypothetical protein
MIWLTWRQFRLQAAVIFGAVAVLVAVLAATGPRLVHLQHASGSRFLSAVSPADTTLYVLGALAVLAVPPLVGMFWGAPLISRELDAGTYRLAWTQTSRARWLAAKLGLVGLAAMAAAGLLSLAVSWWASPIDAAVARRDGRPGPGILIFARFSRELFDSRGVVPFGYAALAFVLGATLGVIVRRTLPAMALLLAVFAVTQVVMSVAVRPHLITPERLTTTITAANLTFIGIAGGVSVTIPRPGAWITAQHTVSAAGVPARIPSWAENCPVRSARATQACFARLARAGYRQVVSYQPAGRFWSVQCYETMIYLVIALVLAGVCAWWLRRRLS